MKSIYAALSSAKQSALKVFLLSLFSLFGLMGVKAQTVCTQNDPACATALPDLNATFTGAALTSLTTGGLGIAPIFTISPTANNTTTLTVNSNQYMVTTPGCVLVSFTEARIGNSTVGATDVSVVLANGTVLTCPGVTVNPTTGNVCIKICDPRIVAGELITVRLAFSVSNGNFNNEQVVVSAFALLNVAANFTCPTTFVCLGDATGCTPCDPNFSIFVSKVRVFFPTAIPVGTPTPTVTAIAGVTGGVTTPLTNLKACLTADAGTTVARTYADYCIYANAAGQALSATSLNLTLQSGTFPAQICNVTLNTLTCPSGFAPITDTRTCTSCDPNFLTSVGKVRVFFPTAIPAGVPNPTVASLATVVGNVTTPLTEYKLCAFADAGTDVARTYVDYCVFSNLATPTPFPYTADLSIQLQNGACALPQPACVITDVTLPSCPTFGYEVMGSVTNSTGGTTGNLGTCATTTTCSGSLMYIASRVRITLSTCLPAGVPAPSISSFQTVNADGSLSVLNNDYCFVVSDESAALINTVRCTIEYCVYSRVAGNTFFVTPPATLQFNIATSGTAGVPPVPTPLTTSCNADRVGGPVPVTLTDFNYQVKNCGVNLKWSTAQESNSKEFIVQNSTNGTTWTEVGKVNAKGFATNRSNYSFVHPNPVNGQNFYRFAAVDRDGSTKYSDILTANVNCGKSIISANPNPFVDNVNVYLTSQKAGIVKISLLDNTGRQVYNNNAKVISGSNTIKLTNLSRLPKGVYILSVTTDEGVMNQKIVK